MAELQAHDPINVVDHDLDTPNYLGHVVITVSSCFSSFALTFKARRDAPLKDVKEAFGKCADWHSQGLKYFFNGKIVEDDHTPTSVSWPSIHSTRAPS
jgi:hypothetical protein